MTKVKTEAKKRTAGRGAAAATAAERAPPGAKVKLERRGETKVKLETRGETKVKLERKGSYTAGAARSSGSSSKAAGDLTVAINRAPVLTLWMAVCLERLGLPREAALGAAKVIAGRCAMAKGRALGVLPEPSAASREASAARRRAAPEAEKQPVARIAGQAVRLVATPKGLRAADPSKSPAAPIDGSRVEAYLRSAFKDDLEAVQDTMARAAASHSEAALRSEAMRLYERFRPAWKGWGVRGELHLADIRAVGRG